MKRFSTLALVAAIGLLQTGCFNTAAESNQPQEAQAAAIAAPVSPAAPAQVGEAAVPSQPTAAPAAAVTPVAPVAAASVPTAPASPAPVAPVAPAPAAPAPVAPAPAAPPVSANTYFVSTNDGTALNVRATNSTQAQVIGSLPQGSQVTMHLSDRSGEWFEVSASGVRGWVAAAYLIDPSGYRAASSVPAQVAPAPAPSPARASNDGGYGDDYATYYDLQIQTRDGDSLNLRSGPTLEARAIRAIPNGTYLNYVSEVGRWTKVQMDDGVVGYVASDYVVYR